MENNKVKASSKALLPFLVFIVIYMGSGVVLQAKGVEMAFYQFPSTMAIFLAIVFAFFMFDGTIEEKFTAFVDGAKNEDIIIMCFIFLLAGAFSTVSKNMGAVDSTVNFALSIIPANFITAGIFIIACFISIAAGTSMGTIIALGPIAVGLAEGGGLNLALVIASLVGGAMFGDNLSIISDTTIAATRTQNVDMRDKFRLNLLIALAAAIPTIILLIIFGKPVNPVEVEAGGYNIIKILPYILVLATAIMGVNVFVVLASGIFASGIIGMLTGELTFLTFAQSVNDGYLGMFDITVLALFVGGLAKLVERGGGIQWILDKVSSSIKGKKSAQLGIAALVSLVDIAVANNTIAIIITGPIAKEISHEYKVDPRRTASLLDSFSCVFQGAIPYGGQLLVAVGFGGGLISFVDVMPLLWYQMLLAVVAIISIYVPFTDGMIKKDPWNYEYDMPESKVPKN